MTKYTKFFVSIMITLIILLSSTIVRAVDGESETPDSGTSSSQTPETTTPTPEDDTSSNSGAEQNTSGNSTNESNNNTQTGNTSNTGASESTTINSKSNNANLSNLGIRPHDFSGFKANISSYNVTVPEETESVEVYAKAQDSKASISGTGNLSLREGLNVVSITVTAEDGTTKTYTLNIIRRNKFKYK